ncbi:hypothetical protein T07_13389, partial [Trichinella nelsoni]
LTSQSKKVAVPSCNLHHRYMLKCSQQRMGLNIIWFSLVTKTQPTVEC